MKVLDKIALVLFSSVIFILSVLICFCIFGWIKFEVVTASLQYLFFDPSMTNITLGVLVVFILLAIKGIFFTSDSPKAEESTEKGILIQNENGTLLISKDTIQNLVSGVVKEFEGAKEVTAKVTLSKENEINVDVNLFVEQEVMIKDLSNKLQLKIKDVVKKSMDVDIKQVNIKIKNVTQKTTEAQAN